VNDTEGSGRGLIVRYYPGIQGSMPLREVKGHTTTTTTTTATSSVSIVFDDGLDNRAVGVRSPARAKDFSSNLCVQTGSEVHPASCTLGTGVLSPGQSAVAA
jgi:hypothetical protein